MIQNLLDFEVKPIKSDDESETDDENEKNAPRKVIKNPVDLARLKLEKLMKDPTKPVIIPEQVPERDYMQTVPTFVRNVMGSSAGAGSGEFHVYRHLRRKEYARQKAIHAKSMREQLDEEYRQKLEDNRIASEIKTAKKRAKRLKKKIGAKKRKLYKVLCGNSEKKDSEDDDESSDDPDKQDDHKNKTDEIGAQVENKSEDKQEESGAQVENRSEDKQEDHKNKTDLVENKSVEIKTSNIENESETATDPEENSKISKACDSMEDQPSTNENAKTLEIESVLGKEISSNGTTEAKDERKIDEPASEDVHSPNETLIVEEPNKNAEEKTTQEIIPECTSEKPISN